MPSSKAKKAYYEKNKPRILAKLKHAREVRKENKIEQEKFRMYQRNRMLVKRYGICHNTYEELFLKQDGVCAICATSNKGVRKKYLDVDHDHMTGKVRGLLCGRCNKQLGVLEDKEWVRKAMKYVSQTP